jgi:hypothetical protein
MLVLRCDKTNPKAVFTMLHFGKCRFEMKPYLRAPALLQFFRHHLPKVGAAPII